MKKKISARLKVSNNVFVYELIKSVYKKPLVGVFYFLIKLIYSYYISFKIFGLSFYPRVYFSSSLFKVKIKKNKKSKIIASSSFPIIFESFLDGDSTTTINVASGGVLKIRDTFIIGDGCRINVAENACLELHGQLDNRDSGITCNTIILCSKMITIGKGTIISWGGFITDSSQHSINGILTVAPVIIGDKVWISENVTIAPGAVLSENSIVGAKSIVKGQFPSNVLLAGVPAQIKKVNLEWTR